MSFTEEKEKSTPGEDHASRTSSNARCMCDDDENDEPSHVIVGSVSEFSNYQVFLENHNDPFLLKKIPPEKIHARNAQPPSQPEKAPKRITHGFSPKICSPRYSVSAPLRREGSDSPLRARVDAAVVARHSGKDLKDRNGIMIFNVVNREKKHFVDQTLRSVHR